MSYKQVQQLATKFNKLAGEVVDFQAEKAKRNRKAILVLRDGSTYEVPDDCEIWILNSDGVEELDDAYDAKNISDENIINRSNVSDLITDHLNKFNC